MGEEKDLLAGLVLELRRGTLILSVLSQMAEAKYGYALVQSLEEKGVEIDPSAAGEAGASREPLGYGRLQAAQILPENRLWK